tara:strand:- start:1352 stop:1483 length:132 start_codon:yes stop_codon:yes gene_type:complete
MTRYLADVTASLAAILLMAGSFAVITSVPAQTAHAQVAAPALA